MIYYFLTGLLTGILAGAIYSWSRKAFLALWFALVFLGLLSMFIVGEGRFEEAFNWLDFLSCIAGNLAGVIMGESMFKGIG